MNEDGMAVTVVICTYAEDLFPHLNEAIQSIMDQTYGQTEVVVVVDGNESLYEIVCDEWDGCDRVNVLCNEENRGLSASRNAGIERASGDVIAFMDDDAVADPQWLEELVHVYETRDVAAVGGKMTPIWVAGQPSFLPAEFYWLVGVTHRGFPDEGPVRNAFGSNISFRTDVLEELGGFTEDLGRKGESLGQGEETELAARLREELGGVFYYTPAARVGHKVFAHRTDLRWLLRRAYQQGVSKRKMEQYVPGAGDEESAFLKRLLLEFVPHRIGGLMRRPSTTRMAQLGALLLFTAAVGIGYVTTAVRGIIGR